MRVVTLVSSADLRATVHEALQEGDYILSRADGLGGYSRADILIWEYQPEPTAYPADPSETLVLPEILERDEGVACLVILSDVQDGYSWLFGTLSEFLPRHPIAVLGPDYNQPDIRASVQALSLGLSVMAPEFRQLSGADASDPGLVFRDDYPGTQSGPEHDRAISGVRREPGTRAQGAAPQLGRQDRQLLKLIGLGLSNAEVGSRLGISVNTVKFHLKGLYAALDVHSRSEAIYRAIQLGLVAI